MTVKMVPLSARVTPEDAEFIAQMQVEGATTPSDKVRAIIAQERERREGSKDYAVAVGLVRDIMMPALRRLRGAECAANLHSELVSRLSEWLPDICGYLLAEAPAAGEEFDRRELELFEQALADRVLALVDTVLRMGLTSQCRCYSPSLITDRLEPTLELAQLIMSKRTPGAL